MSLEEYRNSRNRKCRNSNGNIKVKRRLKRSVRVFINRVLITVIVFLVALIVTKDNGNMKKLFKEKVYTDSIHFTKTKEIYNKYFGKYIGDEKKEVSVFTEKLDYSKSNVYKDGVKLTVSSNYLVPALDSGVVIYIGDNDDYGSKVVVVEQVNGVDVYYGNVEAKDIKLYDYVEKGALIGEVIDTNLYLAFQKEGKFVDYKKYL
ncbi:MAG: peptidoglycan DD-metalloendopeptidase family protein [Bacilli bacterium]|nr:peptidoglycan DD-metalloendopeptidase family protein [Bacilli bacterium]